MSVTAQRPAFDETWHAALVAEQFRPGSVQPVSLRGGPTHKLTDDGGRCAPLCGSTPGKRARLHNAWQFVDCAACRALP